jgi:tRNA-2-methylthio-N6-dimethylallyladenosine synthase
VAINTDIIVGFCGETDAQFERTVEVVRDLKFDKVHLARYSPRPGTVSERRMADDVPEAEKVRRHKVLEDAARAASARRSTPASWARPSKCWSRISTRASGAGATARTSWSSSKATCRCAGGWSKLQAPRQITWTGPWSMQGRFVRDVRAVAAAPDKDCRIDGAAHRPGFAAGRHRLPDAQRGERAGRCHPEQRRPGGVDAGRHHRSC